MSNKSTPSSGVSLTQPGDSTHKENNMPGVFGGCSLDSLLDSRSASPPGSDNSRGLFGGPRPNSIPEPPCVQVMTPEPATASQSLDKTVTPAQELEHGTWTDSDIIYSLPDNITAGSSGVGDFTIHAGEGTDKRAFSIPLDLICARSPKVKELLNKDPQNRSLELKDTDPRVVDWYVQLVKFNQFSNFGAFGSIPSLDEKVGLLWELCILANFLQDTTSVNAIIGNIVYHSPNSSVIPSAKQVSLLYEGTTVPSKIRKLALDLYAWKATVESMRGQSYPEGFEDNITRNFLKNLERDYGSYKQASLRSEGYYEK
ncbi:hypothetical protein GQ44DRAFT_128369 [Phaeosphaeriaceae sp. PMI808]|nr:hypothetical protein GQ44DRAFT_128369 [Phaeosphaeriaceae sp. PMI808]